MTQPTVNPLIEMNEMAAIGANISQMINSRDPHLSQMGTALAQDLAAWREMHYDAEAFAAGRLRLREKAAERTKRRLEREGPQLWAEWHRRALQPVKDEAAERAWLAEFAKRLPCGECRKHFQGMCETVLEHDFEDYFENTVVIHNLVNDRLGKPRITIAAAREIWERP